MKKVRPFQDSNELGTTDQLTFGDGKRAFQRARRTNPNGWQGFATS